MKKSDILMAVFALYVIISLWIFNRKEATKEVLYDTKQIELIKREYQKQIDILILENKKKIDSLEILLSISKKRINEKKKELKIINYKSTELDSVWNSFGY